MSRSFRRFCSSGSGLGIAVVGSGLGVGLLGVDGVVRFGGAEDVIAGDFTGGGAGATGAVTSAPPHAPAIAMVIAKSAVAASGPALIA